jgi:hypothetical protein
MGMSRRGERLGWALSRVFKSDELGALHVLNIGSYISPHLVVYLSHILLPLMLRRLVLVPLHPGFYTID